MKYDYNAILDNFDRSYSLQFVERLKVLELSNLEEEMVVSALDVLQDPRTIPLLESILEDRTQALRIRERASKVLGAIRFSYNSTPAQIQAWWSEGDQLLKTHALRVSEFIPDGLLIQVAANPEHPLQSVALGSLGLHAESTSESANVSLQALNHSDPRVRFAGLTNISNDEPISALSTIVSLTEDPDQKVRERAVLNLMDIPSVKSFESLIRFFEPGGIKLTEDESVYESLKFDLPEYLENLTWPLNHSVLRVRQRVKNWIQPILERVENILADLYGIDLDPESEAEFYPSQNDFGEEEDSADVELSQSELDEFWSEARLKDLFNHLSDPINFTGWLPRFRVLGHPIPWESFPESQRADLIQGFKEIPDASWRSDLPLILRKVNYLDELLDLLNCEDLNLRIVALSQLELVDPDPRIAELLLESHASNPFYGFGFEFFLNIYIHHASRADAVAKLIESAESESATPSLKSLCVVQLTGLEAKSEVQELMKFFNDPPRLNWEVQIELLYAMTKIEGLKLPKHDYDDADHVQMQVALGFVESL